MWAPKPAGDLQGMLHVAQLSMTIEKRNNRITRRFISHQHKQCATRSVEKQKKRERERIPINKELTHADTLSHNIIARALAHHIVYL
jgi:mannitol-1-phosphate/altronate dehydrogenase